MVNVKEKVVLTGTDISARDNAALAAAASTVPDAEIDEDGVEVLGQHRLVGIGHVVDFMQAVARLPQARGEGSPDEGIVFDEQ